VKQSTELIVADLRDLAMFVGLNDKRGASLIRTAADRLEELERVVERVRKVSASMIARMEHPTDPPASTFCEWSDELEGAIEALEVK
jgi:hypothetical protein